MQLWFLYVDPETQSEHFFLEDRNGETLFLFPSTIDRCAFQLSFLRFVEHMQVTHLNTLIVIPDIFLKEHNVQLQMDRSMSYYEVIYLGQEMRTDRRLAFFPVVTWLNAMVRESNWMQYKPYYELNGLPGHTGSLYVCATPQETIGLDHFKTGKIVRLKNTKVVRVDVVTSSTPTLSFWKQVM